MSAGNGKRVKITLNGRSLEVPAGTNVLEACLGSGTPLEHFCYHRYLPVDGNCRTCMVEIETPRGAQLAIGCNTQVTEGLSVRTDSERARRAQRSALEFLLLDHPLDCPVCDKAGECKLQDNYMTYGLYDHRRRVPRFFKGGKAVDVGAHIVLDQERCVLCTRCIRFCDNVTGTGELGIVNRGNRAVLTVFSGRPLSNPYSGNTTDVCPVGALTLKEFRFRQRVWFLKKTESVCPGCARGCNITIEHNRDRAWRFMPRENPELNRTWICDEGRLSFPRLHEGRLESPLSGGSPKPHGEALSAAAELLSGVDPASVWAVASPHAALEDLYALKLLFVSRFCADNLVGVLPARRGEGDDLLRLPERWPNAQGLALLGIPLSPAPLAAAAAAGKVKVLLVLEGDPLGPGEALEPSAESLGAVVALSTYHTATVRKAALAFPVRTFAEKDGTFVNATARLQRFHRAFEPAFPDCEAASVLLSRIAEALGARQPAFREPREAFDRLAKEEPRLLGLTFRTIPPFGKILDLAPMGPEPFRRGKVDFNVTAAGITR